MKNLIIVASLAMLMASVPAIAQVDAIPSYVDSQNMARVLEGSESGGGKRSGKAGKTRRSRPQLKPIRATIMVNGKTLQSGATPMKKSGNLFVPMREIFEALGAKVTYDKDKHLITAERNGTGMQITLDGGDSSKMKGSQAAIGKGELPYIEKGVMMVPLRFVSEQMGAKIKYTNRPTTPLIEIESKT